MEAVRLRPKFGSTSRVLKRQQPVGLEEKRLRPNRRKLVRERMRELVKRNLSLNLVWVRKREKRQEKLAAEV